jgi:hypothetical protein
MVHEFTECCGWVSYPAGQDAHKCSTDTLTTPDPVFAMNIDLTDDSDY